MEKNFTVNVAKSRLSVGYTKNDHELLSAWEQHQVFKQTNKQLTGKPFVLLDGPPYANGDAHLGHGLNKLLKDLVVKSRWFMGQPVEYRPGWDCHGLPLELAVEKKYGKLDNDTLKKRCKSLAFRSLVKQRKSFKRLGVLGQWDEPYVTLSKPMLQQGWRTLSSLVDKNLLEYKQFPVHYCPACASSLAEAELEDKLLPKDNLYFKMQLQDAPQSYVLVWTTTPWTLPMNQGLVYRQDFTYSLWSNGTENLYLQKNTDPEVQEWLVKHAYSFVLEVEGNFFFEKMAVSPLSKEVVPFLHGDLVEEGKTGFVHMACAHGPEDYELGQQHHVLPMSYLNKNGVYQTESVDLLNDLHGKKYTQVSSDVCGMLGADLVAYSQSQVEQQVCWRHKCGVYYNATWQVFLELEHPQHNLKQKVAEVLSESVLPKHYKERLEQMLLGRKHWCLSRQRQWGCPMNLLVDEQNKVSPLSSVYLSYLSNNELDKATHLLDDNPQLTVFTDVVDVWFDSGNVVNEYTHRNGLENADYAVDLVLEGKDQFRGWFQSLLWLSVATNGVMPYKNLLCHGFVLNEKREKFAKSTGNGKVVEYYADLYGADVLHLWTASQETETDAVFSESKLEEMKRYYSRLRLSLRFLTSNLYDYDYLQHESNMKLYQDDPSFDMHRYLLKEMGNLYKECHAYFSEYQFKKGLDSLYLFCDKTLSNFYFESVKNTMYLRNLKSKERLLAQTGLYEVLLNLFDLVKVYCPFVAEEFYQDFYHQHAEQFSSVFYVNHLTKFYHNYLSYNVVYNWDKVNEYRKQVQAALEPYQKDKTLKSRTEATVHFHLPGNDYHNLQSLQQLYKFSDLFGVSYVTLTMADNFKLVVENLKENNLYFKCPRCWNYELLSLFHKDVCRCCTQDE